MKFYNNYILRFILIAMLCVPIALQAALPDFTGIVDEAKNSVVNISTKTKVRKSNSAESLSIPNLPEGSPFGELFEKFFNYENPGERRRDAQSLGSGFIISKDGYILTNITSSRVPTKSLFGFPIATNTWLKLLVPTKPPMLRC